MKQYELYGSDVFMAMSADASCRGLHNSRVGPLVLELRKDVNGWPNPSCSFPDWLVSLSWRDLAGKQIFNSNGSSQTFVRFTRRKSGAKLHRRSEYRCIGAPPHVTDDDLYTVLTFSTHECVSRYQCLQIRQLAGGAIMFKQGKLTDMDRTMRCLSEKQYESVHILTDDKFKSGKCPKPGIYTATSPTNCYSWADVGCHQRDAIVVHSTCPETPDLTLHCSSNHWRHDNNTYVILTKRDNGSSVITCVKMQRRGKETELSSDSLCSGGVSYVRNSDTVKMLLRGTRERCPGSEFEASGEETVTKESDSRGTGRSNIEYVVGDNGISSDKIHRKELRTAAPSGDHFIKHRPDETVESTAGGAHDRNYIDAGNDKAVVDVDIGGTSGRGARTAVVVFAPIMYAITLLCFMLAN
ncbi:hypothetical protein LSAT2_029509 [Lamellibrachia satsuma]|nr:hypothetical protein LSAT2_029509 [Lamellibrachia satsuma]